MPGNTLGAVTTLAKQGAFDADLMNAVNTNFTNLNTSATNLNAGTPGIVGSSTNLNLLYSAFAAVTLLATGHTAGTYRISIGATVKTTITTATSWLFTAAYTDAIHSQTPTVCTSSTMTANAQENGVLVFYSAGTAAITITPTAASSDGGAIAYAAVLERLL